MSAPSDSGSVLRLYSDSILFNCNRGRFSDYPLLSQGRKKGVRDLLGDRIDHLDTERRLRPVDVFFTAGAKPHKIYMIANVREEVSEEQLTSLVDRMNDMVAGKTPEEQEEIVRELIKSTGASVRPGLPYLPEDFRKDPDSQEHATQQGDDADKTVLESEDEVVGMVASQRGSKRSSETPALPPTSSKLPLPVTDDESTPRQKKPRTKSPDQTVISEEPRESEKEGDKHPEAIEYQVAKHPSNAEDDSDSPPALATPSDDEDTANVTAESLDSVKTPRNEELSTMNKTLNEVRQDVVSLKSEMAKSRDEFVKVTDFGTFCSDLVTRFEKFEETMRNLVELKAAAGISSSESALPSSQPSASASQTPAIDPGTVPRNVGINSVENELATYFPINVFTKDLLWLLEQSIVQEFLRLQVMRDLYGGTNPPRSKAPPTEAIYVFLDYVFSARFQSHIGNPMSRRAKYDFGRMACPKIVYRILIDKVMSLAAPIAEGLRNPGEIIKDKCSGIHTKQVIGGKHIQSCESVEEVAYNLYWERYDFFCLHQWMFPGVDPDNPGWTFEKEVSKVKKFKAYMDGHMDHDETFNLHSRGHPDNIEDSFFPMLVKGKVPKSRQELEELVEALKQTGLSTPTFSRSIWKIINEPGKVPDTQVALGKERQKRLKKTRKRRNAKRRKSADERSVASGRSRKSAASRRKRHEESSSSSESTSSSSDTSSSDSSDEDDSDTGHSRRGRSPVVSKASKRSRHGRKGSGKDKDKRDKSPKSAKSGKSGKSGKSNKSGKSTAGENTEKRPMLVAPVLISPSRPGQLGEAVAPTTYDLFGTESSSATSNGNGGPVVIPQETMANQPSLSDLAISGLNVDIADITPDMLGHLVFQQEANVPVTTATDMSMQGQGNVVVVAEAPTTQHQPSDIVNMALAQSNIMAPGGPSGCVTYQVQGNQNVGLNIAVDQQATVQSSSASKYEVSGTVKKTALQRYEEGEEILEYDLSSSDKTSSNEKSSSSGSNGNLLKKTLEGMDRTDRGEMPPPKSKSKSRESRRASGEDRKGRKEEPKHKDHKKSKKSKRR